MVTILVQRYAHTSARLSPYFTTGILRPRLRSERGRFFFPMVAMRRTVYVNIKEKRYVRCVSHSASSQHET